MLIIGGLFDEFSVTGTTKENIATIFSTVHLHRICIKNIPSFERETMSLTQDLSVLDDPHHIRVELTHVNQE